MSLWSLLSAARDAGRAYEIGATLIRFGFGDVVRRVGLADALERAGRRLHWKGVEGIAHLSPPQRVRKALEELGPTFMKLGQVLATRVDLFGPEWIAEFERLQDSAPAVDWPTIERQLAEDLGEDPKEAFATIVEEPIAAASMAQVHRATTHEGDEVVVKVRRPGIRPVVEADMRLLERLAEIAHEEFPVIRQFQPTELIRQFSRTIRRELDLAAECRSAERISRNFRHRDDVVIPRIYWQWTGERVNVQSFVDGIPGHELDRLDQAGVDRRAIARKGAALFLEMVLEHGFFHADPHPGNFFILPAERIALIDFGMVGRLTEQRRFEVVDLLAGAVEQDADSVVDVLLEWVEDPRVEPSRLRRDVDDYLDQYRGVPLRQLSIADFLADLMRVLRENAIVLPDDLAILVKMFVTLEGFGSRLDPDFDMASEAAPHVRRAAMTRYSPAVLLRRGRRVAANAIDLLTGLPRDVRQLLRAARRGKLEVHVDVTRLDAVARRLDRATSRLTVGIITSSLIIGAAIVTGSFGASTRLATTGFVIAAIAGLWLVASIRRSLHDRD